MYTFPSLFNFIFKHIPEEVTGTCGCYHGYHGASCEIQCAGGADYPCHGKGTCDTETGTCTCDITANVNAECSQCSDGWFGEDCSVTETALQGIIEPQPQHVISTNVAFLQV